MELYKNEEWKEVNFKNEIKKLPNDWVFNFVKDLADVTSGGTPSTKQISYWDKNEVKWLSSGEVNNSKIYNSEKYISLLGLKKSSAKLLPKESVLIALAGQGKTRGQVAITKVELSTNQSVGAILPSNKFNSDFLYFNLLSRYSELRILSGGDNGRGGLNLQKIKNLDIFIPKITEQNKIAELLSSQEKVIEKTKELIKNIDKINQFMIDELLSGRLRVKEDENGQVVFYKNEEWKTETLNGEEVEIPKDWVIKNLGSKEIALVKTGVKSYTGYMDYYATGEAGDFELEKPTGSFLYENKPSRANLKVLEGTIYFARMKNTLKILKFENKEKFLLSTGFLGLKPDLNKVNLDFLYFHIISKHFQGVKDRNCKGATQETLSDSSAKSIGLVLPTLAEQNIVASILKKSFLEKEKYEQILKEEEKKFYFLLEELMSGRLRIRK